MNKDKLKVDSFKNLDKYINGYCRKHNIYPNKQNVINHFKEHNK